MAGLTLEEKRKIAEDAKKATSSAVVSALQNMKDEINSTKGFYDNLQDEELNTVKKSLKELNNAEKESTLMDQWNVGRSMSKAAFDKIKNKIPKDDVDEIAYTVFEHDDSGNIIPDTGVTQYKYRSRIHAGINKMHKLGNFSDTEESQIRKNDLSHLINIEDSRVAQRVYGAHTSEVTKVQHRRELAKITATTAKYTDILMAACKRTGTDPKSLGFKPIEVPVPELQN